MQYTHDELKKLNLSYHQDHILKDSDVEKVNRLLRLMESRDVNIPQDGDVVIIVHPEKGELYSFAHLQKMNNRWTICTEAYTPHIWESNDEKGKIITDASGGYWHSLSKKDLQRFKKVRTALKRFWTWGHCSRTANGGVEFKAPVTLWSLKDKSFY